MHHEDDPFEYVEHKTSEDPFKMCTNRAEEVHKLMERVVKTDDLVVVPNEG